MLCRTRAEVNCGVRRAKHGPGNSAESGSFTFWTVFGPADAGHDRAHQLVFDGIREARELVCLRWRSIVLALGAPPVRRHRLRRAVADRAASIANACSTETCICMYNHPRMRTTVEIKPEHRSALLAIAARRGDKGFSGVVEDAIEQYLEGEEKRRHQRAELMNLGGALSPQDAADLREETRALREYWR
jgi:hypothetical protein